jgi:spore maturation protein CgeB
MDDMAVNLPMHPDPEGVETRNYLFGEYVVNRKLTQIERLEYLNAIGREHKLDLYTPDANTGITGAINHGPVDYLEMAPFVYNRAKINLNISLRSIHTGVPLRCFEIIASQGLLLSNYQAGFEDVFKDGYEYVPFENRDDLIDKIDYLLAHEDEREAIAKNGSQRLIKDHTYDQRIKEMLSYL